MQNCFVIWALLNYIDFMLFNNNFIDVVFKCQKGTTFEQYSF